MLCGLRKPRYLAPCHERLLTEHSIMNGSHQVSATVEKIVDRTMSGKKPLGLPRRLEASHLALALASRLVGSLSLIIQASVLSVDDTRQWHCQFNAN